MLYTLQFEIAALAALCYLRCSDNCDFPHRNGVASRAESPLHSQSNVMQVTLLR
jgi:hypothetical protein